MKNLRHYIARLKYELKQLPRLSRERHVKIGLLVFLITLVSFGIGYLVGRDWQNPPIIIQKGVSGE